MKKYALTIVLALAVTVASAVGVNDIVDIYNVSQDIHASAARLLYFANELKNAKENNWIVEIAGSTETYTITNADKQNLIVRYNNLKAKLQEDFNRLP